MIVPCSIEYFSFRGWTASQIMRTVKPVTIMRDRRTPAMHRTRAECRGGGGGGGGGAMGVFV